MLARRMRVPWPLLAILGACSSKPGPVDEREAPREPALGRVYTSVGTSGWVIEPAGTARRVTHDPTLNDCRARDEREVVCVRDGAVVVLDLDALRGDDVPLRGARPPR